MDGVRNSQIVRVACLGLALSAGSALAQSSFSTPIGRAQDEAKAGSGAGSGESRIMMRSDEDGDSYEITIVNGEVSAKVNGKAVPADRIRRSDDKVEILDKKGNVLKTFDVVVNSSGAVHGGKSVKRAHGMQPVPPTPPDQPRAIVIEGEHPKVMVGITMSQPSDALAEHFGIKTDEAVVIDRVIDGLPADKAGLKVQDIITEVDGVHPVTQQNFRETINKKEPGDKVTVKILRKGEEKKVTVELQKFDSEKLGMGAMQMNDGQGPEVWQNVPGWPGGKEWQEQLKEALKGAHGATVFGPGGPGERFQFTPFGGTDAKRLDEMQSQIDKKIAELDEKLAKINEQMERLEKLLNKMGEKQNR